MLYAQTISHIFTVTGITIRYAAEIGKVGKIQNRLLVCIVMFCIVVKREQTVIG